MFYSGHHNTTDSDEALPGPSNPEADVVDFNNEVCFICQRVTSYGTKLHTVTGPFVKDTVMKVLMNKKDPESLAIKARIEGVDLVRAKACYHMKCVLKYRRERSTTPRGRTTETVDEAMEHVYLYIEENIDVCQFAIKHLAEQIPEEHRPAEETLKKRLEEKYGDEILLYNVRGAGTVLCFKNIGRQLLTDAWYSQKSNDKREEKLRVIREAGALIREDIRSKLYPMDEYPATTNFMEGAEDDVPESLMVLLEEIVLPSKRKSSIPDWKKTVVAIAHAILKAARPRCFLSKVLLAVGCYLKKKFGSKLLIDTLSAIGFSCSYWEIQLLELSCIFRQQPRVLPTGFSQWVADNADFNVNTLDGRNSWHVMALIQCVTPSSAIAVEESVSRIVHDRKSTNAAELGKIELVPYDKAPSDGLKTIEVLDLDQLYPDPGPILPTSIDLLFAYGKWKCDPTVPGWNGFMEQITEQQPFEHSKILYLPFINAPPTELTTVVTTLLYAYKAGTSSGQKLIIITFDQQLYWKARDIIGSAPADSELQNIFVRLGGFHLIMSFMGAIGKIMSGSGLENAWATIYAEGSIPAMLLGKSYGRAIRAHLLTNLSLVKIVLDTLDQDEGIFSETRNFLDEVLDYIDRTEVLNSVKEESFVQFSTLFEKKLLEFEQRGPTAKLWVQYIRMTSLLKQFIEAERTGNWDLHVTTVRKMLPFFHASEHFNYAKSAHLYLQDVASLKERMTPVEFNQFTKRGFFTIRRSEKHFSGISPDQTIEQTTMRLAKTRGGLTIPGKGITDNETAKWALSMYSLINICEQLESYAGVYGQSSEQHVDMRPARVKRDNEDIGTLDSWFAAHDPFPSLQQIVSIGTGIVGDETINCHLAEEEGLKMMSTMSNTTFALLTFKRKEAVKPLSIMCTKIKVKQTVAAIDPMVLFQRMAICQATTEELRSFLTFELAPYPMSLFDDFGMRKGTKSSLYDAFDPEKSVVFGEKRFEVFDGGYLLHKVKWNKDMSITDICERYVRFLKKHSTADKIAVVFDGYSSESREIGTKSTERLRRSTKYTSPPIQFDQTTVIHVSQENFLSNDSNKDRLIQFLQRKLLAAGFETEQDFEDADRLIVQTALQQTANYDSVTIIGEDIDLLVLLVAMGNSEEKVYFKKPSHGNTPEKIYSTNSFKHKDLQSYLLFLHAFTGCDTTSAPYLQGKLKLISLLQKEKDVQGHADIFNNKRSLPQHIEAAGRAVFVALYGGASQNTLADVRFKKFNQCAAKTKINLCSLPPSPDAADSHSKRVYFQIQAWMGNYLEPTTWGWKQTSQGLEPIRTTLDPAPEELMKLVTCSCKMNSCGAACGCRKAGLLCTIACKNCSGENCSNVQLFDEDDDLFDDVDLEAPTLVNYWPSKSTRSNDKTGNAEGESTQNSPTELVENESPRIQPVQKRDKH